MQQLLECPSHADRYYLGEGKGWVRKFTEDVTNEGIIKALSETPYVRCVYRSDKIFNYNSIFQEKNFVKVVDRKRFHLLHKECYTIILS
jgi:hypothetical protein